ncbi:hypothetical protein LA080_007651 [Diaporthe eres]|nr:hypothetical protein LA080_007651 [Diaporthe eres]
MEKGLRGLQVIPCHCSKPDIIVEDGVPHCQSCHTTSLALEKRLVEDNRAKGGAIQLPEAVPLGKASLWWPPSVPYRSPRVDGNIFAESCNEENGVTAMLSETSIEPSPLSPIYPSSLGSNQFRLIYLTESGDVSSPIHFRLEEYAFDDYPEYETVSYVWGGENCDCKLCKPVYVGRFWDVILATHNCSALLHYLRRREVCRTIWVDAICINQADNTEKPAQISRMGDIYCNCERVRLIFTNERDPVENHFERPFDQIVGESTELAKICADGAGISQDQFFQRRYLARIWVVQELLLSNRAIFPLGDFDILCDRKEATRLILRSSGDQLDLSAVTRSLPRLLQATCHCHASDSRDRVYGLLGLFQPQDFSEDLTSNYTLSWRDCWVGTAAYLLLVERELELLTHALGHNCPVDLPSWVLDIVNMKSWRSGRSWWSQLESIIHDDKGRRTIGDCCVASGKWVTEFVIDLCIESRKSATVDSSNGALQLKAIRVFDGPCRPTMETEENGLTSIWVRGPSTAAHFRIMGPKSPVYLDESYQLFIISCEDTVHPSLGVCTTLLALTTALSEKDVSFVTIHDCNIIYDVHFYSMDHLEARMGQTNFMTNHLRSLHWVLQILHGNSTTNEMSIVLADTIFHCILPSFAAKRREILPLLRRLLELRSLSDESPTLVESISAVAERICPEFDPVIRNNYFHLTIKHERMWRDWSTVPWKDDPVSKWQFNNLNMNSLRLEVNYFDSLTQDKNKWVLLGNKTKRERAEFWKGPLLPVTLRFSVDYLLPLIKSTTMVTVMCYAHEFSSLLNEDFVTPMARKPTPKDSCIFLDGGSRGLLDELGLVWKLETIPIRVTALNINMRIFVLPRWAIALETFLSKQVEVE